MKRFIAIILFVSSSISLAYGQELAKTGSVYSKIGLGQPVDLSSSSAEGMGLPGVSFVEPFVPSLANPAQWGSTVYGMATGSIGIKNYAATDNQASSKSSLLSANYFQLQLPLSRNKVGISIAVAPLTRANYYFRQNENRIINSGSTTDTLSFQSENMGDGGVNMLEAGVGWNINSYLSVGYAASLIFTSVDNKYQTAFSDSKYTTVNFNRQTSGLGFGNRIGAMLHHSGIFKKDDNLSIGATLLLPVTIAGNRVEETTKVLPSGTSQTLTLKTGSGLGKGDIKLPMTLSGGITYQPGRLLAFSAEGLYQNWSDYENKIDPSQESFLTNRYKIGLGLRYFPYFIGSDTFLSHFKYRVGTSYDNGYINLNGQRIETLMFSFGLGILSPKSNSSIDLSFEYGIRGTRSQNLVKENIWGLKLSLNLAELMFFRPKLQ